MQNKFTYLFLLVGLLSLALILNCGDKPKTDDAEKKSTASSEEGKLAKGKEAFEANCASCHGNLGAGDGPAAAALNPKPRNFKAATSEWKNGKTKEGILKTLKEGIAGGPMVAYPHLEDVHEALAEYVLELGK
jgi:mono/diheme cytochrome c family protein